MTRIYGYVKQYPKGCIRVFDLPDFTDLQQVKYDWTSIYGDISEELPRDMPVPQGKLVITTTYEDANLYHEVSYWCSTSGKPNPGRLVL